MTSYSKFFAEFYDRHFGNYAENAAPFLLHFASDLLPPALSRKLPILELGCGTGRLAYHFLSAGYCLVGLDLSPAMLSLAEVRCFTFVRQGKAAFLPADIKGFQAGGPFGLAISTYNVLNHLEPDGELQGCFRSLRHCLADGARFLFDYHTLLGLRAWGSRESFQGPGGKVESLGFFDEARGRAVQHLKGEITGEPFEETITNYSIPLEHLVQELKKEGFQKPDFRRIDDLSRPLDNPESENRVVVLTQ